MGTLMFAERAQTVSSPLVCFLDKILTPSFVELFEITVDKNDSELKWQRLLTFFPIDDSEWPVYLTYN